jgi:hypothetical protein
MLTVFLGSIFPEAETMASRSRFCRASAVMRVPCSTCRANRGGAADDHQREDDPQPFPAEHV